MKTPSSGKKSQASRDHASPNTSRQFEGGLKSWLTNKLSSAVRVVGRVGNQDHRKQSQMDHDEEEMPQGALDQRQGRGANYHADQWGEHMHRPNQGQQHDETMRSVAYNDNEMSLRPLQDGDQDDKYDQAIQRGRKHRTNRSSQYSTTGRAHGDDAEDFEIMDLNLNHRKRVNIIQFEDFEPKQESRNDQPSKHHSFAANANEHQKTADFGDQTPRDENASDCIDDDDKRLPNDGTSLSQAAK